MNILTFDIEEWFHLLENESTAGEEQWSKFEVRIHENTDRILRLLDETNTSATFFIIGWIAKQYPEVVRKIADSYEIGSHTVNHDLISAMTPDSFRRELTASIHLLEDITGKPVRYFRAPGFSITEKQPWAFEIIAQCGIEIDCSVFPAAHAHGGIPSFGKAQPSLIEYNGVKLKEFPISTKLIGGRNLVFSGGGYFRLLPYPLIRRWSRESEYLMSYLHPRDLDPGQPMVEGLSAVRKFKSYVGLGRAERKLRRWLTDFEFCDLASADKATDWSKVPVVKLG